MSNHITFRRGQADIPVGEQPMVGEPKWNPVLSCLGMFNNIAGKYEWYPRVFANYFMLHKDQLLTGTTSSGADGNVVADWSTPDELIIRNRISGKILGRFTESGVYLHNPIAVAGAEVGISNRALNSNLAVTFAAVPLSLPLATTLLPTSKLIAPNWLFWKKPGSSGEMSVDFDETDHPPGVERAFRINATGAPNGAGLRSYIHDHETFRNREVVVSGWFKGTSGRTCMMRIGNSNGIIYQHEFAFVGGIWEQKYFSTIIPDEEADYLYIDFVYNPSRTNPNLTQFRAAKFAITFGQVPPRYESRSVEMERGLLCGIFKEGSVFVTGTATGGLDLGLVGPEIDIATYSAGGTVTVSDANSLGAAVSIPGGSGLNRINYRAASVIRTTETN